VCRGDDLQSSVEAGGSRLIEENSGEVSSRIELRTTILIKKTARGESLKFVKDHR
jgi:hypothetical protein